MKTFLDLSDKQVSDIVRILYQTYLHEKITRIVRNENSIEVVMEAYDVCENGTASRLADDDVFVLTEAEIMPNSFIISDVKLHENNRRYQQFLFAKGCHWINQDSEFLFEEE